MGPGKSSSPTCPEAVGGLTSGQRKSGYRPWPRLLASPRWALRCACSAAPWLASALGGPASAPAADGARSRTPAAQVPQKCGSGVSSARRRSPTSFRSCQRTRRMCCVAPGGGTCAVGRKSGAHVTDHGFRGRGITRDNFSNW